MIDTSISVPGRAVLGGCVLALCMLGACSSNPSAEKSQIPPGQAPGPPVKITQFYASPPAPEPGAPAKLCYGVDNAATVRLDPPVEKVWPAMARCFDIEPRFIPGRFKLTAERGEDRVSKTLTIRRGAPQIEILEVRVDALEVAPGTEMHVCYKARNAASITVTPGEWFLEHTPDHGCVIHVQQHTTTYAVLARDSGGDIIDGEEVTVRVR